MSVLLRRRWVWLRPIRQPDGMGGSTVVATEEVYLRAAETMATPRAVPIEPGKSMASLAVWDSGALPAVGDRLRSPEGRLYEVTARVLRGRVCYLDLMQVG